MKSEQGFPEQKSEKEILRNEFGGFYEEHPSARYDGTDRYIARLLESDPGYLREVLGSVGDLRDIGAKLTGRSVKRLQEGGIELVEDPRSPFGFSTPEGVKKGKLDAPSFFTDPAGYQKYMQAQEGKTPFTGLSALQQDDMWQSVFELQEARGYESEAGQYMFQLLMAKGMAEENRENNGGSNVFEKFTENVSIPFTMFRAKLNGKLAKLRYSPRFAMDKMGELGDKLIKLFGSSEEVE